MAKDKRVQRGSNVKIAVILLFLGLIAAGAFFYLKGQADQRRQVALEEERLRDEAEIERQRRLMEERRAEFAAMLEQMRRHLLGGDYARVRELARAALTFAEEHGFPRDEIDSILYRVSLSEYALRLQQLSKELAQDMYVYFHVRSEVLKIPDWQELRAKRRGLLDQTYEKEYHVILALAGKSAAEGQKGKEPEYNYFTSVSYLERAIKLRERRNLNCSEKEAIVRTSQNDLFFSTSKLVHRTIPANLYQ